MLVDTHAHLDFVEDIDGCIERAKKNGVGKIICVGTSVDASRRCVAIAEKGFPTRSGMTGSQALQIYSTVGIHAEDGKGDVEKFGSIEKCVEELRKIVRDSIASLQNDKRVVVGIGECGFDFREETTDKEKVFQGDLFEAQLGLAKELGFPLVVHCRNAFYETFEMLGNGLKGVFHSWTGDWEAAKRALDLGFYISFSGIVTFKQSLRSSQAAGLKNGPNVQEVASKIPLERMLLETDSPFLAPHPVRGSKNEPGNVRMIAQFIARLRNLPMDQVAKITSENAGRLFGI